MQRPTKRTYFVVMLLGGVALIVDRCVLTKSVTNPRPVTVATTSLPDTSGPKIADALSTGASGTTETPLILELPFPRSIPAWNPQTPIRDIFAPISDDDETDRQHPRSQREAAGGHGTCAGLLAHYHLEAVLVQESFKIAILNGAWVRVGESVDECTLTEIIGNNVRFRCRDGDTIMTLSPRN